jgi:hypothetical protein
MIGRLKNWLAGGGVFLLFELALVAAAAALLAHWTWLALTPRAVGVSSLKQAEVRSVAVKPHLFGASGIAETASGSKLKLVGLAAPSHAVFSLDGGKTRSASVGETIASGLVLREVHADHVVVSNNGALESVKLERRARR